MQGWNVTKYINSSFVFMAPLYYPHIQIWNVCEFSHSDDVDKVVLSQCVQDGVDGVFGNGHLQPLHAATDVHHDDDVFGRRGRLDVPEHTSLINYSCYTFTAFIIYLFKQSKCLQKPPKWNNQRVHTVKCLISKLFKHVFIIFYWIYFICNSKLFFTSWRHVMTFNYSADVSPQPITCCQPLRGKDATNTQKKRQIQNH